MSKKDPNVGKGDSSTEGLPKRINKADRRIAQASAAEREGHVRDGWPVGGREAEGGSWSSGDPSRDH